jgi:uncharacterized protein with FMN-binding domain
MRKFLLSFGLIFVFTGYILYQRSITVQFVSSDGGVVAELENLILNKKNGTTSPIKTTPPPVATGGTSGTTKPPVTSTPPPVSTPSPVPPKPVVLGMYKDGTYTGSVEDAYYGNVQVKVVIQDGKIADVIFLQYPNDRSRSVSINRQAMPYLKTEAIQVQNAQVNTVSGATETSKAFRRSIATALADAKV